MTAKFERTSWQSEVVYDITDAEPMKTGYGPTFVPNLARLNFVNGEFDEIRLWGPRVLASGKPSKRDNDFINWQASEFDPSQWDVNDELAPPEWVKKLVISAVFAKAV